MKKILLLLILMLTDAAFAQAADDPRAGTGLPVPRFVTLKSDEVNVRAGPGTRYPILWVYKRSGWPVEIVEEFGNWRKVRDLDQTTGWVYHSMLSGTRNVVVRGSRRLLRADPTEGATAVLRADPMVIARLLECEAAWCRLQLKGRKGWLERRFLWGVYEHEKIED